jgi:hypothetical protein
VHIDVPSSGEIEQLLRVEGEPAVSLYLPTTAVSSDAEAERIAFKNLVGAADGLLAEQGVAARGIADILEPLRELDDDHEFWTRQARTLAVFAIAGHTWVFRLPSRLGEAVRVSDRFDVKPLLRAVTFPHAAFVLALAQGSCRLIEISADLPPFEVDVPDLPADVASAAGKASIAERSPIGRLQGAEGQKTRMRQYARKIDRALRHVLAGRDVPLILAATSPLDEIFRSVSTYPALLARSIEGNPETTGDDELAARARAILDEHYAEQLDELRALLDERAGQGRAAKELGGVARAATFGAVDTLLVDIDAHLTGEIDEVSGELRLADGHGEGAPGVTDEIAKRTLRAGGRVLAVRAEDVPGPGPAVALLRYPV